MRKTLHREIASISVNAQGEISQSDKTAIAQKIQSALKAKEAEFGLEVISVEVRGAFPSEFNVPDKLRALDPPLRPEDAAGHGLSADYWSEVLSPPYFEKRTFGSGKEIRTPATVSLEWAIPSPPDYHHFNEVCWTVCFIDYVDLLTHFCLPKIGAKDDSSPKQGRCQSPLNRQRVVQFCSVAFGLDHMIVVFLGEV